MAQLEIEQSEHEATARGLAGQHAYDWSEVADLANTVPTLLAEIDRLRAAPAPAAPDAGLLAELARLRSLATPGTWEPRLDDSGDSIGIMVREDLWDGPVTPEMAEAGIDQQIVGEEITIVANMAWDEAGNELKRIDDNINYVCALHRAAERLLLARHGAPAAAAVAGDEALALVARLAAWSRAYPRGTTYNAKFQNQVEGGLVQMEEDAKRLCPETK